MSTDQQIAKLEATVSRLHAAVQALCQQHGARLTKQQLAERLGVHRNTLASMLERDRRMPRPCADGKFLLSDVIAWETYGRQQ